MRIRLSLAFTAACLAASPAIAQTSLTAANLGIEGLDDPVPVAAPGAEATLGQPTLAELVTAHAGTATADEESECLARAVYWESRGEPLSGQLAVAEVVINRARSGRFAPTLCGVVRQPYQFSFVRRGYIPQPPLASRDWQVAVAIARIASDRLAQGGAPDALFFHARRVNPGWRLTRVATVGNHVFYR
jgi:N-acetylmuramoyl-L-alanine amidase